MSSKAKRRFLWFGFAGVLALTLAYLLALRPAKTQEAAEPGVLQAVSRFQVGTQPALDRSAFSGKPLVKVLASPDDPALPDLTACLQTAEVEAAMLSFTGVLVDVAREPKVESDLRAEQNLQVVIRAANGTVLATLAHGTTCHEMLLLLDAIRAHLPEPVKSPVYLWLLESPKETVQWFLDRGLRDQIVLQVGFLRDLEGDSHPSVIVARTALGE